MARLYPKDLNYATYKYVLKNDVIISTDEGENYFCPVVLDSNKGNIFKWFPSTTFFTGGLPFKIKKQLTEMP